MRSIHNIIGRGQNNIDGTYRPDIDGLRGVAVLAVLLYHVSPSLAPGGFLGVDVFFVISGFLIGGLLLGKMHTGTFSLRAFYLRRIRRLAPALTLVLAVTMVVYTLLYTPIQLVGLARDCVSSIFGVANIRYSFADPYTAVEAIRNPLLHTWSLGVEEQFYVLIPAALWLIWRLVKPRFTPGVLLVACLALFAFSLARSEVVSEQAHFFLLPSRAWELMLGVALVACRPNGFRFQSRVVRAMVAMGGLVSIVVSFAFLDVLASGPGPWTLLPTLGAAVVIGAGPSNASSSFLSRPIPVFIGLISYPLYLWHFPLLAFWEIVSSNHHLLPRLGVICVAMILATLTFVYVEWPIRHSRRSKRSLVVIAVAFLGVIGSAGIITVTRGLPFRVGDMPSVGVKGAIYGPSVTTRGIGRPILVLGDSHMAALPTSLKQLMSDRDETLASWVVGGCQFLLGTERADRSSGRITNCTTDLQQQRLDWINSFGPSTVILGGRLPLLLEGDRFNNEEGGDEGRMTDYVREPGTTEFSLDVSRQQVSEAYRRTVTALLAAGHHVVLVYPIPEVGVDVPTTLVRRTIFNSFSWPLPFPLTTSFALYEKRTRRSFVLLDSIQGPGITRVRPDEFFCNVAVPGRCVTHSDTEIFYEDDDHLSKQGLDIIAREVLLAIDEFEHE